MSGKTYTQYLLDKYRSDFDAATQHPFLLATGDGSIDQAVLTQWLRQDYLYAYVGYLKFASLLLSRLPLPTSPPGPDSSPRTQALGRAIPLLTFSLANIKRETDFFVQTAQDHGLDLHPQGRMPDAPGPDGLLGPYTALTRSYVDFLGATAAMGSLEDGLVLLWAMEKAYHTAWSYAKRFVPSQPAQSPKEAALRLFVDNWTCDEFVGFVRDCTDVVDGLEIDPDSETGKQAEEVFKRTLWLEQRFWPSA
ncbi:hypothetical protein DB88DRAFT_501073 [Papiliotrema laurentii]|uniref:Thiaminase-2/PQQC domain-containing protein n=1 Tax=Papiliotrema laurentii TaxID=5418 RepID=A0AAD9CUT7_PAPLA|nr:hypothetical protein DB88DRAFT_501073 [Papiliotrema laurentii]